MIQFDNVTIAYGKQVIVKDYNLNIKKGEKVLIKAPSGSGKSTLIKAMLGFVLPSEGTISINEIPITCKDIEPIRSKIAYVSQDVELMGMTAKAFMEEIQCYKLNRQKKWDQNQINVYMEMLDLDQSILDKNPKDLSGGERQRVGLLIALMLDRDIFLLDEVTAGLDLALKSRVYQYFIDSDKTVVVSSHDALWETEKIRVVTL